MLNSETLNQIATANEAVVEKQFNKLRYSVRRLDRNAKRPRPDFLISNRAGRPEMLCEVKTVHSAGYLPDREAHISMLDAKLCDTGVFENQIDLTKISDNLADAVRKRNALAEDDPDFADLPLLVAFFFDFFADHLVCYPRTFDAEVSGILTIEKDIARTRAFGQLSTDEQKRRLKTGRMNDLPSNSKDFILIRNKAARRSLPRAFQDQCFTERYDESI
jgi:hypothetical protein